MNAGNLPKYYEEEKTLIVGLAAEKVGGAACEGCVFDAIEGAECPTEYGGRLICMTHDIVFKLKKEE